uniref:Uncharacterized protein n=1 Tax=Chromera velia CCMP2878 TaxID=1169474 RepID=A0A0G4IE75_9ALVE|eukprot:Cvel_13649.t1-p1 / transcript=Cvel_13649.t1 / gene=Cvel_13649 / organism=Chromera_velia_CCMP2878 / gene_product=hypothetical protein / transcript_product=hypothetical protein / location=Cvel_scaffold941:26694-28177(-) / protein_length=410 / sequence_SO=supercontig / SO=protein_coding / is_pseudo=false
MPPSGSDLSGKGGRTDAGSSEVLPPFARSQPQICIRTDESLIEMRQPQPADRDLPPAADPFGRHSVSPYSWGGRILGEVGEDSVAMEFLGSFENGTTKLCGSPSPNLNHCSTSLDPNRPLHWFDVCIQALAVHKDMVLLLGLIHADAAVENFVFHEGVVNVIDAEVRIVPEPPAASEPDTPKALPSLATTASTGGEREEIEAFVREAVNAGEYLGGERLIWLFFLWWAERAQSEREQSQPENFETTEQFTVVSPEFVLQAYEEAAVPSLERDRSRKVPMEVQITTLTFKVQYNPSESECQSEAESEDDFASACRRSLAFTAPPAPPRQRGYKAKQREEKRKREGLVDTQEKAGNSGTAQVSSSLDEEVQRIFEAGLCQSPQEESAERGGRGKGRGTGKGGKGKKNNRKKC